MIRGVCGMDDMGLSESTEMYLETISLLESEHGHAHVADIAGRLGITKPSVSKAMNQLKNEGFVDKETYGQITLTEKGRRVSNRVFMKHRLIASFLEETLGLGPEEASRNACRMEHIITDSMVDAVEAFMKKRL